MKSSKGLPGEGFELKVLVTGSGGLVGKEIAEILASQKNAVIRFDRGNGCDILDAGQLKAAVKGCEAVVHCAALLNENRGKELLWKTNVDGTQNVLDACIQNRVKRLVFLSSVGVYGTVPGTKSESSSLSPKTVYDKSKFAAEQLIVQNSSVPFTIVRSALVVGPNVHWKKIFSFVQKDFPLAGNASQAWQTIDYKDLAKATVFLLFSARAQNEIFVVAASQRPTLVEFTDCIRTALGKKSRVRTVPFGAAKMAGFFSGIFFGILQKPNPLSGAILEGMRQERAYDTSKIEKLGWKNVFSYQESIRQAMQELKKQG